MAMASCAPNDVLSPTVPVGNGVPIRSARMDGNLGTGSWSALSDSALWEAIAKTDTVVVIGLKEPGEQRGVVRGKSLVSPERWKSAVRALASDAANPVQSADTLRIPMVRVRPANVSSLARLRRLPFVEYVEPNHIPTIPQDPSGCSWSGSSGGSGDSPFTGLLLPIYPAGDNATSSYFTSNTYFTSNWLYSGSNGMNVGNAWQLASGAGVTIGITDTGLDISPSSEFSATYFASGYSAGRSINVVQGSPITCSHGTRIAGLAAAPMNGRLISGVAYKANVVSVKHSDGSMPDETSAGESIDLAALNGAKVIVMAWAQASPSWYVNYVIDYWHYNHDVMFVGAAGTCEANSGFCPFNDDTALFPASKEEVLAVTGANANGTRPAVYDYGNKSGVIAFTGLATVGLIPGIVAIRGSSGATGFVAGAAALVRSRHPEYSARQTMDAIIWTSGIRCGAPLAWRDAMINVSAAVGGPCVGHMLGDQTYFVYPWNAPAYTPVDYWVRTLRTSPLFSPGGSGVYSALWQPRPEQEIVSSVDDNYTDAFGNYFWRTRRSIRFLPAWDGLPYLTTVETVVGDTPFGTADRRSMQVLVCPAANNCAQTTREWPVPPPPPPPLSAVSINGPALVASGYGYSWSASVTGGAGNYSYSWTVGSSSGTSTSIYTSLCQNGIVNVSVTDGVNTVSAALAVVASDTLPAPPGGQFVPCS